MYGENNGEAYFLMDDFGGKPAIFGNIPINCTHVYFFEPSKISFDYTTLFELQTPILGDFVGGATQDQQKIPICSHQSYPKNRFLSS